MGLVSGLYNMICIIYFSIWVTDISNMILEIL
jgi:hypothetical protein